MSEKLVVWWLSQEAMEASSVLGFRDAEAPTYILKQFTSAFGKADRGRLWIDDSLGDFEVPWKQQDLLYGYIGTLCAGIVIRLSDVEHVLGWPGFIADASMQLIRAAPVLETA